MNTLEGVKKGDLIEVIRHSGRKTSRVVDRTSNNGKVIRLTDLHILTSCDLHDPSMVGRWLLDEGEEVTVQRLDGI
jgi:hypothetical protein